MTMKIHRSILWLAAIVVVFIVLVFCFGKKKPMETPVPVSTETNIEPVPTSKPSPAVSADVHTNAPIANAATTASTPKPALGSKEEGMLGVLSTYNDVPIDFYGKLEDQGGNPVAGAEIKGSIMVINGQRQGTDHFSTTSDANGLFEFHGRGENIGMMPRKEGYALASTETLFKYSRMEDHPYVSDANNPTVIKMWKLRGAEPLLKIRQNYKLHYNAEPIYFDLIAGTIVPSGGDIKMTVSRSPGLMSGRIRLDWSVQVEAVNGGLMDSDGQEAVTYTAPDSGYQPSDVFIFSTNAPNKWFGAFNQGLFLMSRNGQVYSKLNLFFRINSDPDGFMNITFDGVANTNSSQNWEGDPNTYQPR
jgi:hypothetical protein